MRFAGVGVVWVILTCGLIAADGDNVKKPKVKLAVVVFFDQMRGDLVEKWQPHFGEGGFKRMQENGAWFTDCHYPYGTTTTAPGHASVLAGCSGNKHGIVNNNWYDRQAAKEIYSAASDRYDLVPAKVFDEEVIPDGKTGLAKPKSKSAVGNPDRFIGSTLADVLRESTGGNGKTFGVSLKDRSAIFPMGRKPNGVYWFSGQFMTSTYYRDSLPGWVTAFNNSGTAQSYFNKPWTRLREDLDYTAIVGPDDAVGESFGPGKSKTMGRVFPHAMNGGKEKISSSYYEDMATSPYGNDLLLAFAKECIVQEKLGQDDTPDLLTISFSSNDLVGHAWGPDSHEVLDITLRSDRVMADLLKFLDDKVGEGKYSVLVTADHGVQAIPEVAVKKIPTARRIAPLAILKGAETLLRAEFGEAIPDAPLAEGEAPAPRPVKGDGKAEEPKNRNLWIEAISVPNVYINRKHAKARGVEVSAVAAKLVEHLRKQPGIVRAYTAADLLGPVPKDDEFFVLTRNGFHPDRSGDVVIVSEPFVLFDTGNIGTTHGTPHPDDTHTVFLVYGPGIEGGKRTEKVTPLHASPITAEFLGVNPPRTNEYSLPQTLTKPTR
ncbi:MAG: alkaline phosphatase family protein [Fimbriiglobus sp.]